ncbi:MAG: UbiA family prenyltransferase, partial [Acidobacteriota bacterium]
MNDEATLPREREKLFALLQLMRFPNVFTAMADVIAGGLIVLGPGQFWTDTVCLSISSAAIYAGGCVLNDLCDRDTDAIERPSRPIPSARVSHAEALGLTCLLFTLGLVSALSAGWSPFFVAIVLTGAVVTYDTTTKSMEIAGPLNMGVCRGLNLLLGMSPALSFSAPQMLLPLISTLYVFSLTRLSRFEVSGGLEHNGPSVLAGWLSVLAAILGLKLTGVLPTSDGMAFLALFALVTGLPLIGALQTPSPELIINAVKAMVLA